MIGGADHLDDFARRILRLFREKLRAEFRIAERLQLLLERRAPDLPEGLVHDEGIERGGKAKQKPRRARRHLAADRQPVRIGSGDIVEHALPDGRPAVVLFDGDGHGTARKLDHAAQHREFLVRLLEIGNELQHAFLRLAHGAGNAVKLHGFGLQRRRGAALHILVLHRARGGKAERARVQRLDHDLRHLGGLRFARGLERGRAIAHHIGAHGGMRNLQAHIERERRGFHRIHIFGEALPVPLDAFGKRRTRNILDTFHQAEQPFALLRLAGRKAHAAIAHYGGRHAMEGRGLEIGVPGDLAVIMRMHIDEARRDDLAARVDFLRARARDLADLDDAAARNGDIGVDGLRPRPVEHGAAADHDIVAHGFPSRNALNGFGRQDSGKGGAPTPACAAQPPAGAAFCPTYECIFIY